jgi:hypothetical protein
MSARKSVGIQSLVLRDLASLGRCGLCTGLETDPWLNLEIACGWWDGRDSCDLCIL